MQNNLDRSSNRLGNEENDMDIVDKVQWYVGENATELSYQWRGSWSFKRNASGGGLQNPGLARLFNTKH